MYSKIFLYNFFLPKRVSFSKSCKPNPKFPLSCRQYCSAGKSQNTTTLTATTSSSQPATSTPCNPTDKSVGYLREYWAKEFEKFQISEPTLSIDYLLNHALGISSKNLSLSSLSSTELGAEQMEKLNMALQCRLARMPVQYIVGDWDFLNIKLKLVPPVFIPRPETEQLVLLALERLSSRVYEQQIHCLELCTGSGAISLAMLHKNSSVHMTSVEKSILAVNLAKENAQLLKLDSRFQLIHASLEEDGLRGPKGVIQVDRRYDLLVSNPPYVPNADLRSLAPEILLYEDLRALDGGRDGLRLINIILSFAPLWLKPGGVLLLEIDPRQPTAILASVAESAAWADVKVHNDFAGKSRFLELVTAVS